MPPRPSALDALLATGLAAWGLTEALALAGPGSAGERAGWALLLSLPVAWRRHAPAGIAIGLAAAVVVRVLVAEGAPSEGAMPFPSLLVATFSAAAHASALPLAVLAGLATYGAMVAAVFLDYYSGNPEPADAAILSFFVVAAWAAGWFVRRRALAGVLQARDAVSAERARIARELHDVIGHALSVVSLQAGAAEVLLRRDPDRAEEHLRAVQGASHEALAELRRLMGVMRDDDAGLAPQPGLATLGSLVDGARETGLDVELRMDAGEPPLPAGVDLAAYRIVQEALTNARRHAGAVRVRVAVRRAGGAVELDVENEPGRAPVSPALPGGGGRGLVGMRERVRVYGGTLEAGPLPDGRFRVRARLPVEAAG